MKQSFPPILTTLLSWMDVFGKPDKKPLTEREKEKNFFLGVVNGMLFIFSESLIDPTLVLSTFVNTLTNSPLLVGLVVPLRDGFWALPQLWVSGWLQNLPHKMTIYRLSTIFRSISWGLLAISVLCIRDPMWLLISFFILYTFSALMNGLGGLPFMEVVGKTIPSDRFGEFFAWRMGIGGMAGIGASFFVRWILDANSSVPFPQNYGILIFCFFVGASIGIFLFNFIREPIQEEVLPINPFFDQIKRSIQILKVDKNFLRFVLMQSSQIWSGAAIPFYAIFVQSELGGSKAFVGIYLGVVTFTNLICNAILGNLSRKIGYKNIMIISIIAGLTMSAGALALGLLAGPLHFSAQFASYYLIPIFILSGIRRTGMAIGSDSLLLYIVPPNERSLYIGFSNSLMGLVLLSAGLSGVIMEALGFPLLVILTILLGICALMIILRIDIKFKQYR
jgi:MFS family permease